MSLRHERRRRLLSDDSLSNAPEDESDSPIRLAPDPASEDDASPAAYASAVRFDRQRRIHDLLPTHYATIGLVVTAALALVAIVELLHVWSGSLAGLLNPNDVLALSLRGSRNLSHWLASTLLVVAGMVAMFIYSLRRHRVDDYHGRYRVWIWTALGCVCVSLAETADVAVLARGICRRAADFCSLSDRAVWPAVLGTVLSASGIRLLFEVRKSRLAATALAASAASFLLAAAVDRDWLAEISAANKPLAERGSWLVGYVFLLAMFLLYARHVVLEIEGPVVPAPAKPKRSKAKPPAEPHQKPVSQPRTDLDPVEKAIPASASTRLQLATAADRSSAAPASSSSSAQPANHGSLSRAERRRLRREDRMAY
jgi:hypothetical protein